MHQRCNFVISAETNTNRIVGTAVMHVIHQDESVADI